MLNEFLRKHILAEPGDAPTPDTPTSVKVAGAPTVTPSTVPVVDNEFVNLLRTAIRNRPTAYTTLLAAAEKLVNVIPDPTTRVRAAFEMNKGEGRGLSELLAAITIHVNDLGTQKAQFEQAMARQRQSTVGALQAELDGIGPAQQAAQQQITALQQQIADLTQQMNTRAGREGELRNSIIAEEARFTLNQQQFDAALTIIRTELDGQKAMITTALT